MLTSLSTLCFNLLFLYMFISNMAKLYRLLSLNFRSSALTISNSSLTSSLILASIRPIIIFLNLVFLNHSYNATINTL
jgi:hypothetical protein